MDRRYLGKYVLCNFHTIERLRFDIEENTIIEAFVGFRFASVAITNEYTLRYPSQNEGRGCGGWGDPNTANG